VKIVPNVYQITRRGVNIILIAERGLTLIDTGFHGSLSAIKNLIHHIGRSVEEVTLIIITHNHPDHIGGLRELRKITRAKVAAHKADIGDTDNCLPFPRFIQKLLYITPFFRPLLFPELSQVDIPLEGDEVLSPLGGLRVIHTPGHTPGSISLFSPQKKLLIVGDTINGRREALRLPPESVSTDLAQALDSVKRLTQLDFNTLCFGHGRPLTTGALGKVRELIRKGPKNTWPASLEIL